jgi:O-acetyl-ADP-ribose deacetylase (regulator of RNase III)
MSDNTDKIIVIKGDITKITADVIVNAANTSLLGGGGVDGAIHRAGGPEILEGCRNIVAKQGGCKVGEAVITTAGKLAAKYVIHTVGPVWNGGKNHEIEKLESCYHNALTLAVEQGCHSIAFPNISTGIYRFPKELAAQRSIRVIKQFLMADKTLKQVKIVCFDDDNFLLVSKILMHA